MSNNKYVFTNCVSTTQAECGKINGFIESIKVKDHKITIKTSMMILIIKNEINFFSCEDDIDNFIGCNIYSWTYHDDHFIFEIDGEDMQVDIDGNEENMIQYGKRKFGTVNSVQVARRCIIIKTNRVVIKIKNKNATFDNIYGQSVTDMVGCKLFGWKSYDDQIIFKTNSYCINDFYVYCFRDDKNSKDSSTFYDPDTYVDKSIYGTVKEIEENNHDITIKTTKGEFTFAGWYNDDGLEWGFCPKVDKNINNMIGKCISHIKSKDRKTFIHCNDNSVYKLSVDSPDSFCYTGITYNEWFF